MKGENLIKHFVIKDTNKTLMMLKKIVKDEHQLFTKICSLFEKTLVFDTKNYLFYFNKETNPTLLNNIYSTYGKTVYEVSFKCNGFHDYNKRKIIPRTKC